MNADEKGALPMGRWLMRLLVVLAVLLGGWWWIATTGLQKGLEAFWQNQRNSGLDVAVGDTTRSGFPLQIAATVAQVDITDPATQTRLQVPQINIASPIYWPGHASVRLPDAPIVITTPQGALTLTSDGMQADMRLHAGPALQLEALAGSGTNIAVDAIEGRILGISAVQAQVQQGASAQIYHIRFDATGFAPGSLIRQALQMPNAWAQSFEPVVADMTVTFDRPWDRSALQANRPQPRAIQITQITTAWETLGFAISGALVIDANGIPDGDLRIQVRNWQRVFDMAVDATDVPPAWISTVEQVLQAMSDREGTLDLPLKMENGQMRVGFLPLGPTPRIVIP